ncbi:MAG: DUF7507 domain-containing protein [Dermatophilaceae bacterium]
MNLHSGLYRGQARRIFAVSAIMALGLVIGAAPSMACSDSDKAWVCKYKGTPGVNEVLKDGKQPILVARSSTVLGYFQDGQDSSFVLALAPAGTHGDYTGTEQCPAPRDYPVTAPVVTPGTCTEAGSVVAANTEGYTWKIDDGKYTAEPNKYGSHKHYILTGDASPYGPFNVARLTGEQCASRVELPTLTRIPGTCDAMGSVNAADTEHYTWGFTGPAGARLYTATAIGDVVLVGAATQGPFDLSQTASQSTNSQRPCYVPPESLAPDTPAISLVKDATLHDTNATANTTGKADAGETISYSFKVTNTGNVALTGVAVVDPKLDSVPGSAVTCAPTALPPGGTVTCTAAAYIVRASDVAAGKPIVNVATASGQPPTGSRVTATDTVSTPSQEPAVVAGIVQDAPVVAGIVQDAPAVAGIVQDAPAVHELAFTGSETVALGLSGLVALVLGAVLMVARRRQGGQQARE